METKLFKRDFFYKLESELRDRDVIFLLGPRKCGKTYALLQLKADDSNNEMQYFDFKTLKENESMDLINSICNDILSGKGLLTFLMNQHIYTLLKRKYLK